MKKSLVLCALFLTAAIPAHAQFSKPERAVEYRQAAFTIMNNHFGRIFLAAQGKIPYDKDAVLRSAEVVEFTARLPWEAFGPGTDLLESKAKPSVWSEQARFKQLATEMQAETVKLTAAARTGNLDNVRNAVRATVKTCDTCHDDYRSK